MDSYVERSKTVAARLSEHGIGVRVQVDYRDDTTGLTLELSPIAILCLLEMLADDLVRNSGQNPFSSGEVQ